MGTSTLYCPVFPALFKAFFRTPAELRRAASSTICPPPTDPEPLFCSRSHSLNVDDRCWQADFAKQTTDQTAESGEDTGKRGQTCWSDGLLPDEDRNGRSGVMEAMRYSRLGRRGAQPPPGVLVVRGSSGRVSAVSRGAAAAILAGARARMTSLLSA